MCTYSFQQSICPCAKGHDCPQMARGRALVGGEMFHLLSEFLPVDELGAACDYQRRMFGRHAPPTLLCPRYAFDDKRVINGTYKKVELACVKCAESCAPPSIAWQAPGPHRPPAQAATPVSVARAAPGTSMNMSMGMSMSMIMARAGDGPGISAGMGMGEGEVLPAMKA